MWVIILWAPDLQGPQQPQVYWMSVDSLITCKFVWELAQLMYNINWGLHNYEISWTYVVEGSSSTFIILVYYHAHVGHFPKQSCVL